MKSKSYKNVLSVKGEVRMTVGRRMSVLISGSVLAAMLIACLYGDAQAAVKTWDTFAGDGGGITDGTGNWSTGGGNWNSAGDSTWVNGDTAIIGAGGTAGIITLTTPITNLNGITFNAVASGSYVITNSGATSILTLTGTPNILATANAEIAATLAGSVGLLKTNAGTLTLSGPSNTLTGTYSIWGGGMLIITGTNTASLNNVGTTSSGNSVWITPPLGRLTPGAGAALNIGGVGGNNNTVLVSAPGSGSARSIDPQQTNLGAAGNNNSMILTNGANVNSRVGFTVGNGGGSSNKFILTGANTSIVVQNNNGSQFNGAGNGGVCGSYNSTIVSNGATLTANRFWWAWANAAGTTGNTCRITGTNSRINIGGNGAFVVGFTANTVSNSLIVENGGVFNHTGGISQHGIGQASGANSNSIVVNGTSSLVTMTTATTFIIGGSPGPTDQAAIGNHLDLANNGAVTLARNLILMGSNSVVNLGDGNGTSVLTVGPAPTVATTNNVVLYKPDARLNINSGRLVAGANFQMVSGPGQIVISGPAYLSTVQAASVIESEIAGATGNLIKEGSGPLTCWGVSNYTADITVSAGSLKLLGDTGSPCAGTLTVMNGLSLNLGDSTNRVHPFAGLNLTNSTLGLNWTTNGTDTIITTNAASVAGSITFDFVLASPGPGTFILLDSTNGGLTSGGGTYSTVNGPGGETLSVSDTQVTVTVAAIVPPLTTAYWRGGVDLAAPNSIVGTNWSTNAASPYVDDARTPGSGCDVFFSADVATNQSGIDLGASKTFNSLTFNDTTAVTITNASKTLTVNGPITANQTATIDTPVTLGGASPTTNSVAPGAVLTLGRAIGGNTLAKAGGGTLRLTGTNTFGTLPLINEGTLSLEAGGNLTLSEVPITTNNNITVKVDGSGSFLYKSAATIFVIGSTGSGNSLICTNGGQLWHSGGNQQQQAFIGNSAGSSNNTVVFSGTGTFQSAWWRGMRETTVGSGGSGNSLLFLNGGYGNPIHFTIGGGTGSNNYVVISGTNSRLQVTGGAAANTSITGGASNHLDISDGGLITSGSYSLSAVGSAINLGNGLGIGVLSYRTGGEGQIGLNTATARLNINSGRIADVSGNIVGGSGTVTLYGPFFVSNTAFSGTIPLPMGGVGSLIKEGSNALTLSATNTYSGNTIISDGTLRVGLNDVIPDGAGKGSVSNAAASSTLDLGIVSETINGLWGIGLVSGGSASTLSVGNDNATSRFDGAISGAMALRKIGSGVLTLGGTNTFNGSTIVSNGTLRLTGGGSFDSTTNIALAAGTVLDVSTLTTPPFHLKSGQELSGNGQVAGNMVMDSGSTLRPGSSVGTLTVTGDLTITTGSLGAFELGSTNTPGTDYDQVVVGGTLTAAGVSWTDFSFTTNSGFSTGVYTLVSSGVNPAVGPLGAPSLGGIGTNFYGVLSLSGSSLLLSVFEGVAPPTVLNRGAIAGTNSATLKGELMYTGNATTEVLTYWGDNNGGTNKGQWDFVITNLTTTSPQLFSSNTPPILGFGKTYYYRTYATNANGEAWAPSSVSFMTLDPRRTGGLLLKTYDTTFGSAFLNPIANLIAVSPSGTTTQMTDITYGSFAGLPGLTAFDTFSVLWTAWFDVSKDGTGSYTFGTDSDDGSVVYMDLNADGDFADVGELIVNNNGDHGTGTPVTGSVTLNTNRVAVAIGFYENSGGEAMTARFKKGGGLAWASLGAVNGTNGYFYLDADSSSVSNVATTATGRNDATVTGTLRGSNLVFDVYVKYDITNAAMGTWANEAFVGSYTNVALTNLVGNLTGLTPSTTYYWAFEGRNEVMSKRAQPSLQFQTKGLTSIFKFR